MKGIVLLGLVVAICASVAEAQQKLYRWTDASGRVHYTDAPPPGDARGVEQKKLGMRAGTGPLPYETQLAMRTFPVVLFTTDCGKSCAEARALLDKRGVPFAERNAQDAAVQAEILKLTGSSTIEVPILMVGKSLTKGWEAGLWDAALDAAGYPKRGASPSPQPRSRKPAAKTTSERNPESSPSPAPAIPPTADAPVRRDESTAKP